MKTIPLRFCLAVAAAALMLPALATRAAFFTTDTTIGVGDTNYDGQDIIVFGCTLTVDGSHAFSDVLLVNNGMLTHSFSSNGLLPNPVYPGSYASSGLNLVVSNNLVIEAGSAISADGKGFGGGLGSGAGASLLSDFPFGPPFYYTSGGGGGFGGFGGSSLGGAAGGSAYGQVLTSTNLGSGGGAGSDAGGAGGGSIVLVVGGDVLVDGEITANGANGTNGAAGGGSGGGIQLSAQSIEGAGSISANGGTGQDFTGGGGGGGRIAIYAGTNDFAGTLMARGGLGAATGGAGTIYTISTNFGNIAYGQVVVDNGGEPGTNSAVDVSIPFDLTISGGAVAPLVTADLGSLLIGSNSWATSTTNSLLSLKLSGNATIEPGGGILLDGEGYGPLGAGLGTGGTANNNGTTTGGGGGYGGYGGASAGTVTKIGGNFYGSVTQPNISGSGGGTGAGVYPFNLGGSGGGAIMLSVAGTLQLGGLISANGLPGFGEGSGGGSGGSIWVTAEGVSGNGTIAANGGAGQLPLGGGGGGGRIAILVRTNSPFAGGIFAHGGAGFVAGGAGTIYTFFPASPAGNVIAQLLVDNGGQQGTNTGLGAVPGPYNLFITNGAVVVPLVNLSTFLNLTIATNSYLAMQAPLQLPENLVFTVSSNVTIQAGGGIVADGAGLRAGFGEQGSGGTVFTNGLEIGGGGGHGGYGGIGAGGGLGGTVFGSITQPQDYGGPGGTGSGNPPSSYGGAGGGFISLTIGGTLRVDGSISANGNPGMGQGSGGGAGGTIRLSTGRLAGSGIISANGGAGESNLGGGGGGGRIAVSFASNQFAGTFSAHGGSGFAAGGAGTIYTISNFTGIGQIVLDNGGLRATNTLLTQPPLSDLTLTNGATASFSAGFSPEFRNLLIASNSLLTLPSLIESSPLQFTANGNVTIQSGGGIIVDGESPVGEQGLGGIYLTNGVIMGGGGSHGGTGGSSASGVPGGAYSAGYGDTPNEPGLPGGNGGNGGGTAPNNAGGVGGGAVRLTIHGTLLVSGTISANGMAGMGQGSGGGAGGSIWLTTGGLLGNGTISANGGAGEPSLGGGGGGGGGRIAINLASNLFTGVLSAYGGAGFVRGGAGTIYIQSNNTTYAQLLLDNGGSEGAATSFVPNIGNYDLTLANGAILSVVNSPLLSFRNLLIESNSTIVLTNAGNPSELQVTASGNATIQAGGAIILDGQGYTGLNGGDGTGSSYLTNGVTMGGGGGNAGNGGSSASGVPGGSDPYYYDILYGGAGGNGGGAAPYNVGGVGGGAVQMTVSGTLLVAGKISANGNPGVGAGSGGGAGGSVSLTVGGLLGNGTIAANGGAGEPSLGGGGGGGGGRISVVLNSNLFTGAISAYGGAGFIPGGAGIISIKSNSNVYAQVVLDNGGLRGTNTPFEPSGSFDLTVANGAVLAAAESLFNVRNFLITSNGAITLYNNGQVATFNLSASGNATIQPGGAITLDGLSTSGGSGSGGSTIINNVLTGGGGGYGGYGGSSSRGVPGGTSYGSITAPESLGSIGGAGGGTAPNNRGGYGGAAIQMNVTGTLQLGGVISANGTAGLGQASGGGSGGSVWVTAGGLTGSGAISANGGAGEPSLGGGGGGGGGRMALILGTNQFSGSLSAHGGPGGVGGGAGTRYVSTQLPALSQLDVDNGGMRGTNTPLSSQSFNSTTDLTVTNGAVVVPGTGQNFRNLMVGSNSFLTVQMSLEVPQILELFLNGSATIQPGGGLIVDGDGYSGILAGPGSGNSFSANGSSTGAGGGYGGNGGASAYGGPGGVTYGSVTEPNQAGSNGGHGNGQSPSYQGGAGGGSIQLSIVGGLQLGGIISANGLAGTGEGSGGGSGGSIQISTRGALSGNGTISANGGSAESILGGGGGGGRIAITSQSNVFTGTMTAYGGQGFAPGGAGTIYTKSYPAQYGQVVVDAGSLPGLTTFTALPTFSPLADLILTGSAKVYAPSYGTLAVNNLLLNSNTVLALVTTNGSYAPGALSLSISGNATVQPGAQIVADGAGFFGNLGTGAGSYGTSIQGYPMGTGGSYGGYGGGSAIGGSVGNSYGSITLPNSPGSGGGCSVSPNSQSAGGGSIQMHITGNLDLEGSISANGSTPFAEGCGGGAGGSINLGVQGTFSGAGAITANGGAGNLPYSGGGGGGRIAISSGPAGSNQFVGSICAFGGQGFVGGGAGTIYNVAYGSAPRSSEFIDNGGLRGTNTPLYTPSPQCALTVSGGAIGQLPSTNSSFTDPTLFMTSLLVQSNGVITTASANDNASLIVSGNALIATNGFISVDGKGYDGVGSAGPGAGMMLTNGLGSGSGGGYGGMGGASASGEPGGLTYGSSQQPIDWGSQGGVPSASFVNFSQGGGAIRMEVGGALTVNGAITANGKTAVFPNTGGGAGGSIWLSAGEFDGNGVISANGGAGEPFTGGGGGGGRIALYYLTNNFTGHVAAAGASGASPGQNGTVVETNLPAPQFISQSPIGTVSNAVSSITLTCNSQFGQFSFPLTNFTLMTPGGILPAADLGARVLNDYPQDFSQIIISWEPPQTEVGLYTLQINEPFVDLFGLLLPPSYAASFTIAAPVISGTVTDTNHVPVAGVALQPSGGLAAVTSDANGKYSIAVPPGWTGNLTASLNGFAFIPSTANFSNPVGSANQNFVAVPTSIFALNTSAQGTNVNLAWFGASGVTYQVFSSTNCLNWQPYGAPINGTNGAITVAVPAGSAPQMFFRFGAVY